MFCSFFSFWNVINKIFRLLLRSFPLIFTPTKINLQSPGASEPCGEERSPTAGSVFPRPPARRPGPSQLLRMASLDLPQGNTGSSRGPASATAPGLGQDPASKCGSAWKARVPRKESPGLLLPQNLVLRRRPRAASQPRPGQGGGRGAHAQQAASAAMKTVTVTPSGTTCRRACLDSPDTCTCARGRRPLWSPAAPTQRLSPSGAPSTSPESRIRKPGALPGADSFPGLQTAARCRVLRPSQPSRGVVPHRGL